MVTAMAMDTVTAMVKSMNKFINQLIYKFNEQSRM